MKFFIITALFYGGYVLYSKYNNHMKKFNNYELIIKQEKIIYNKKIKKNLEFEDNQSAEIKKVKAKNDKNKIEPTGVDFNAGNHVLSI